MIIIYFAAMFMAGFLLSNGLTMFLFFRLYRPCLRFIMVIVKWVTDDDAIWEKWQLHQLNAFCFSAPSDQRQLALESLVRLNELARMYKRAPAHAAQKGA